MTLSLRAKSVLRCFPVNRAGKAVTALRKAGESEFDAGIISELVKGGALRPTTRGWYIRAA